jgi:hypothetical protein
MHSVIVLTHKDGSMRPAMSYSMNAIGLGTGRKMMQRIWTVWPDRT